MARHKDGDWNLHDPATTSLECIIAVLMDVRDELKELNGNISGQRYFVRETHSICRRIDERLAKRIKLK